MSYIQFVYNIILKLLLPPEFPANCAAHFRPLKNWKGEFGFDWIRVGKESQTGDTKMFGDEHYAKIMGKYKTADREVCNDINGWEEYTYKEGETKKTKPCAFKNSVDENDTTNYEQMCNEYFPYRFIIP